MTDAEIRRGPHRPRWALRPATTADVPAITQLVQDAYRPYLDKMDSVPGPMLADYAAVLATATVIVAVVDGQIAGLVVTTSSDDDFVIENVAVHPQHQGMGLGSALLDDSEARAALAGHHAVRLYTHEQMTDNVTRYHHRGYTTYAHEPLPDGRHLVHLRKPLGSG